CLQLVNAAPFLVHTLQCGRKDLFSVERQVSNAWETPTPRLGFSPDFTLLLSCPSSLLLAQLSQAHAPCLLPLYILFVNRWVVCDSDCLVLFMTEKTALALAGHRHRGTIWGAKSNFLTTNQAQPLHGLFVPQRRPFWLSWLLCIFCCRAFTASLKG